MLFIVLLNGCTNNNDRKFKIIGTIDGYKDSTMIYLCSYPGKVVDSSCIVNNQFSFTGTVPEPGLYFISQDIWADSDLKVFWVENSVIKFKASAGYLYKAKIQGSSLQKQYEKCSFTFRNLTLKSDSINNLIKDSRSVDESKKLKIELNILKDSILLKEKQFISSNPDKLYSVLLLSEEMYKIPKNEVKGLFFNLKDDLRSSTYGKKVEYYINKASFNIGDKIKPFELPNTQGDTISLLNYKGKYILIDFWASWCIPCRKEIPTLLKSYSKFKKDSFEIFAISIDTKKEKWKKAILEDSSVWINTIDTKGEIFELLDFKTVPSNLLIDTNGIIIAKNLRGVELMNKLNEIFPDQQ